MLDIELERFTELKWQRVTSAEFQSVKAIVDSLNSKRRMMGQFSMRSISKNMQSFLVQPQSTLNHKFYFFPMENKLTFSKSHTLLFYFSIISKSKILSL